MRIILFLLVVFMPVYANAQEQPTPTFFACVADTDCTIIEDICPGTWMSVANDYEEAYERYAARMRPVVKCTGKVAVPQPPKGACIYEHCRIPEPDSDEDNADKKTTTPPADTKPDPATVQDEEE